MTTPFDDDSNEVVPENQIGALESISRAEIDMSIATARKFPRNVIAVKKEMLAIATMDKETAEACFYALPRGGKDIEGPSVRLAEIAVTSYGNMRTGARTIQTVTDGPNPYVVVQGVAMDLEKNIQVSIEKRRRITKKKSKNTIDEDDINLAVNACAAIAFRDAVFKIVPLAIVKPVFQAARKVAIGDASTLKDKRAAWLAYFQKMGVQPADVLAKLELASADEISLDDIGTLIGLKNAIREGTMSVDEAFPSVSKTATAAKPPQQGKQPAKTAPVTQPETTTQTQTAPDKAVMDPTPGAETTLPPGEAEQGTSEGSETSNPDDGDLAPQEAFKPNPNETEELQNVRFLMHRAGVKESQVMAFARKNSMAKPDQKLSDLSGAKLKTIASSWPNKVAEIKAIKE